MPQDAAYRKYTEQLVTERFNHVNTVSEEILLTLGAKLGVLRW